MKRTSHTIFIALLLLSFSHASAAETEVDEVMAVAIAIQAVIRSGDANALLKFINQPVASFDNQRSASSTRKDLLNKNSSLYKALFTRNDSTQMFFLSNESIKIYIHPNPAGYDAAFVTEREGQRIIVIGIRKKNGAWGISDLSLL